MSELWPEYCIQEWTFPKEWPQFPALAVISSPLYRSHPPGAQVAAAQPTRHGKCYEPRISQEYLGYLDGTSAMVEPSRSSGGSLHPALNV